MVKLPEKYFDFTVTGTGSFPVDMLRYDQCWPQSTNDAMLIEDSLWHPTGKRTIKLTGHNNLKEPTVGRWDSFGWNVTVQS